MRSTTDCYVDFSYAVVAKTLLISVMPDVFETRVVLRLSLHKVHQWSFARVSEGPLIGCVRWVRWSERYNLAFSTYFFSFEIHHTLSIFRGSLASNFLSFSGVLPWELARFLARHFVFSFRWFAESVITHPSALYHLEFCYHLSCTFITSSFPLGLEGYSLVVKGFVEVSETCMFLIFHKFTGIFPWIWILNPNLWRISTYYHKTLLDKISKREKLIV